MIQILGLRPYFNERHKKEMLKHAFFDKNWCAESVQDLFRGLDKFLEVIPEADRWNLFYTVANTHGKAPRDFHYQTVLPIDIDGVDDVEAAIDCVCADLGLARALTGLVSSGNGLHLLIALETIIESASYFTAHRIHYKALCRRVNKALEAAGLSGTADPAVWDHRRILRLPGTENRKPGKDAKPCVLINSHIELQGFDLIQVSGLPLVEQDEQVSREALKGFAKPDTKAVLEGCGFLKACKDSPGTVSEAQWYAMLSILPLLEDGRVLAHDYSRGHPKYSSEECDIKIEQALAASGPRTCKNISYLWDGCRKCKYFQGEGIKSPIVIQSADYIKTKDTGFYTILENNKGTQKRIPCYPDLFKHLQKVSPTMVNQVGVVWKHNGKFWVEYFKQEIDNFAEKHFLPSPTSQMRTEFLGKVRCNHMMDKEWFADSTKGFVNFTNGVLEIKTMKLRPHSVQYGFRGMLPFEYSTEAQCPRFETFLEEITGKDEDLATVISEYIGYVLSGDKIWIHRALVLNGAGSNGKSTLLQLIKYLVGADYASSLSLTAFNDAQSRFRLEGKHVNLGDETNIKALIKSEVFKTVVAGGDILIKKLYSQPYEIPNTAKLILSCNVIPETIDTSDGLFRRLMIVPLNAVFTDGKTVDVQIHKKLEREASGIFNYCLKSYQGVKSSGDFTPAEACKLAKKEYISDSDIIHEWVGANVEVVDNDEVFIGSMELYRDFVGYCTNAGENRPINKATFCRRLPKYITKNPLAKRIKGRPIKGYPGVRLYGASY